MNSLRVHTYTHTIAPTHLVVRCLIFKITGVGWGVSTAGGSAGLEIPETSCLKQRACYHQQQSIQDVSSDKLWKAYQSLKFRQIKQKKVM